jgi:hypothetical protein
MKNWQTRLTQTITFIRDDATPWLRGDKTPIITALNAWTMGNVVDAQNLSGMMSQVGTHPFPDKRGRKERRATILLNAAIMDPAGRQRWAAMANTVNTHPTAQANADYQLGLETARDHVYGTPAVVNVQLARLRTNPRRFLEDWPLLVSGLPNAGVVPYAVEMVAGEYKLECALPAMGRPTIQAFNIPARAYAGVANNLGAIPGTDVQGVNSDLALTTQFTGCAFCFQIDDPAMVATHLDPTAAVGGGLLPQNQRSNGDTIRQQLEANGAFANPNNGTFRVFGRNPAQGAYGYGNRRVIIVSVQRNNQWRVYAQLQNVQARTWEVYRIDQGALG